MKNFIMNTDKKIEHFMAKNKMVLNSGMLFTLLSQC